MKSTLAIIPTATEDFSRVLASFRSDAGRGAAVAGIARLAQTVIFLLGTRQGSIRMAPTIGASPEDFIGGSLSLSDYENLDATVQQVANKLREDLEIFIPQAAAAEEEKLQDLSLRVQSVDTEAGTITLAVTVTTAEDSQTYTMMAAV